MVSVRYANAITELLEYLKGISQEDIDKIPSKLILFLKENASDDYICNLDYNKPLKEMELLDETRGLISMLCLNYWCETKEQKEEYIKKLNENELKHQEELRKIYNLDDIFKKKDEKIYDQIQENANELSLVEIKNEGIIKRIINKIKSIFKLT